MSSTVIPSSSIRWIASLMLICFSTVSLKAQKDYQGLLWEISGNGMERPSYLYGTMHVSNKVAFYLGKPFFEALESVDRVALELEPELWFDDVFESDFFSTISSQSSIYSRGFYYDDKIWNEFQGRFKPNLKINAAVQDVYKRRPEIMNQLLFRFYDATGNFEEDTWLDMYIYQSAKKLGKETMGLETFSESMKMMAKSNQESADEDFESGLSYTEQIEVQSQIETAYRKGDLDLLDSLSKRTSPPSYLKYILIERNKQFVEGLDTLMRQKPVFAAMGAAHLPGEEGCIEMLREMGYTLKALPMGKRDAKQKKKLEKMTLKRPTSSYSSGDGVVSFETPAEVYTLSSTRSSSSSVSMDIPNGITFSVHRLMNHSALSGKSASQHMLSLDSVLYETIPGEIISRKEIFNNGIPGFDILNKTRRGDYHHSQIFYLPSEVIVLRLTGTGEKIKKGLGEYFFSSLALKPAYQQAGSAPSSAWISRSTPDGALHFDAPERSTTYSLEAKANTGMEFYEQFEDSNGDVFSVHRIMANDKGYLDEDRYEMSKLAHAIGKDLEIKELNSTYNTNGARPVLESHYEKYKGKDLRAQFHLSALGYYVFMAFTNDSSRAQKFFGSISISNPEYTEFHSHTDSNLYFSSVIPWKKDESGVASLLSNIGPFGVRREIDPTDRYTIPTTLTPPSSAEWIKVEYDRHGKYSFNDDREDYIKEILDKLTLEGDLVMDREVYEWNDSGFVSDHWLSDTLTLRGYRIRRIMNKHSVHSIKVCYDRALGESDFALKFIENFKPLPDTLSTTDYFKPTDEAFIADIMSEDTLLFKRAHEKLYIVGTFEKNDQYRIYKHLVDNPPPRADESEKNMYSELQNGLLYLDKSPENIKKLKGEFRENRDSAVYQLQILKNLTEMGTRSGMLAARELMLEEAPIGQYISPAYGLFGNLIDTMEISSLLYPQLLELTSYNEYKYPVIRLLAMMLDSGAIKSSLYKSYVPYFTREAKVEFRRMRSSSETVDELSYEFGESSYTGTDNSMYHYWTLLHPYRNNKEVKALFGQARNSTRKQVIQAFAIFRKNKGERISDKVCLGLLPDDDPVMSYRMLKRLGRTDLMPDSVDIQKEYIKERIREKWSFYDYAPEEEKVDSIIFISQSNDSIRSRHYTAYYCKYRTRTNNKSSWTAAVVMVLKKKGDEPGFVTIQETANLDKKAEGLEQFDELRLKLISNNRSNYSWSPYANYDFGD